MEQHVLLKVYLNGNSGKPCFARVLYKPIDLEIPYSQIIKIMRELYGNDCIVTFEIGLLNKMSCK